MIIKLFDMDFEDMEYVVINKNDKRIQEKADFFFDSDLEWEDDTEILNDYNKKFEEHLTLEQVVMALEVTDHGQNGPTVSRYIDVFEALLGYKPQRITPVVDMEIIIED